MKIMINKKAAEVNENASYRELADAYQAEYAHKIVLVIENGKLRELFRPVKENAEVSFVTIGDRDGHESYKRSTTLLMLKAVADVYGLEVASGIRVHFSEKTGYYCTSAKMNVTEQFLQKIEEKMKEISKQALPIEKTTISVEEAIERFKACGMEEKVRLFRFRRSSSVNIYRLGGYEDYFYGYMVPDTGYTNLFRLFAYDDGFVLDMPARKNPEVLPIREAQDSKVFQALKQSTKWSTILDVAAVGALNEQTVNQNMTNIILAQEALMEKELGNIAARIAASPEKKLVMIAGPSSSGKTTFSHRLSVQLMAHGLKPHPIATDNYFVEREMTPKDETGAYNFECLGAMDIKLFNDQMTRLLAGEEVELPTFNFMTGHKEYKGNKLKLGKEDVLVIEGIHCLNDEFSYSLPKENKFKIYLSALTQLNIDEHNRISTSDGRMIRRMVRDARTRGFSATRTIGMWESVRRGEDENIFPYQEDADVVFNSALIYELSVLKQYAEPLLLGISEDQPEYLEAKRLLKFLNYFQGIDSNLVPQNSIIREFIGGSIFNV